MGISSGSSELAYYFDESVEPAVSEQLAAGGLDVVSAHNLDLLGHDDRTHLARATDMGRVLCAYEADFLRLASAGVQHNGIIYAQQRKASIGGWVKAIGRCRLAFHPEIWLGWSYSFQCISSW